MNVNPAKKRPKLHLLGRYAEPYHPTFPGAQKLSVICGIAVTTINRPSATIKAARQIPMRRRANARDPGYLSVTLSADVVLDSALMSR